MKSALGNMLYRQTTSIDQWSYAWASEVQNNITLLTAYSSCYSRQYQITGNEMEWNTQDKTSVEKKWNGIHKKNFNSYTSVYRSNFIFSLFRAEENYRFVCAFSTVLTMHDNSVQNQFYRLISAFTQVLIKFRSQESCQSYKQTIL
jgi:hypothetical protein